MSEVQPPLVLHVIHHLVTGGMENGLVNIVNTMPSDRYRHAIACIEDFSAFRDRIRDPSVEVFPLFRSRHGVWGVRRALYNLCRSLKPAILHSRGMSGLDALLPALAAGVRHRVHGEHGWDVGDLRGQSAKPMLIRRLHSPLVTRYVAVSRDIEEYLVRRVGISQARITHICNGVDTDRFRPADSNLREAVLPHEMCESGMIVVGTLGRLQPVKNQASLMRAFAQALQTRPALRQRLRLAVVGDGPLRQELGRLAESLGIAGYVWMPGGREDVPQVLRAFDVFVLPSLNEGISNTILEASASGLPVIATKVGGNPELVVDRVGGRLIPASQDEALRDAIVEYAENEDMRLAHGKAARKIAVEKFSLERMISSYQALYDDLLRDPTGRV